MTDIDETQGTREPAVAREAADETSVRLSMVVKAPIERAFSVFTERIVSWWPREHHIGTVEMAVAIVEPRTGGRWYELGVDGSECNWGVVLAWDPPRHLALSWHLDGDFRYDADARRSSRVDVRFETLGDGTTRAEPEHSGLDRHGPSWRRLRDGVASPNGWRLSLPRFALVAEALATESPRP